MNERIRTLADEATTIVEMVGPQGYASSYANFDREKFAELIVAECKENFSKVWYEQGMDIRGAEIGKFLTRFNEHFGVEL